MSEPQHLLVKSGLYYRPNNRGYTGLKREAGRYLKTDESPDCGVVAVHEDAAPWISENCYSDYKAIEKERRAILDDAILQCALCDTLEDMQKYLRAVRDKSSGFMMHGYSLKE